MSSFFLFFFFLHLSLPFSFSSFIMFSTVPRYGNFATGMSRMYRNYSHGMLHSNASCVLRIRTMNVAAVTLCACTFALDLSSTYLPV
uniref:Putative secreted peptide n=1 Tax=Anopheles braziliensis TaxID=58242 RepID=A0A2M3ZQF3_9DIPT